VENSHIAHFEFGMVKNGYIWSFPKADGYSIGISTFRGSEGQDFKSILVRGLFGVDVKPLSSTVISGMSKAAYPKCNFGWKPLCG